MFFPNEIITEILAFSDYQTWKNKIKKINRHYHSYYEYNDDSHYSGYGSLYCKIHGRFVANWRSNFYRDGSIENYIYAMCVDSDEHKPRWEMHSQIELPHNY